MKPSVYRTVVLLFICTTLFSLSACESILGPKPVWIVGSWHGNYYGLNVLMSFGKDGEFSMFTQGGLITGTYTIDTTVTPNLLDISMEGADLVQTIALFTDEDTFQFENNLPTAVRPESFSDFILFTRRTSENAPGTPHPAPTYTPPPSP